MKQVGDLTYHTRHWADAVAKEFGIPTELVLGIYQNYSDVPKGEIRRQAVYKFFKRYYGWE